MEKIVKVVECDECEVGIAVGLSYLHVIMQNIQDRIVIDILRKEVENEIKPDVLLEVGGIKGEFDFREAYHEGTVHHWCMKDFIGKFLVDVGNKWEVAHVNKKWEAVPDDQVAGE